MDDLTRLKGIGKAGAKTLADAGLTTFAAVAASYGSRPEGLAASVDWASVVADAATLSGANSENTQERSGTAREAPSTGSGTPASTQDVGAQPAAPPPSLIITGPKRGRWRAGRHFGPQPVTIPLADLTEAEIAALRADPALTVEEAV